MLKPAVFFDRDGVLVKPILRAGIPYAPLRRKDFSLLPGAPEAVRTVRAAGFLAIVVTNQPEVRRGTLDPALLAEFHQLLREQTLVDDILACPHDDRDRCECRKPKPGMIHEAARRHSIDLARSYMIGDTDRDLSAARAAGLPLILIDAAYNQRLKADFRVANAIDAARLILRLAIPPP
ncbi:MAG TPA: HAD-IIIA family hydrolase [Bryobacterales bacterium]|nr:HAD-IIIA family hydrolase [Bryobacterales bacterium]